MSLNKKSISDLADAQIEGKRVLMRVDFNVPLDKETNTKVTDDTRLRAAVPTIKAILEKKPASLVMMSHLGRPDGRVQEKFTLKPVIPLLETLIGESVAFVPNAVGELEKMEPLPKIALLENLRFHLAEEGKGVDAEGNKVSATEEEVKEFRAKLSAYADVYVNDAFGTAHRAHSSMVGVECQHKVAGLLLKKELEYFANVLERPQRPFLSILGGAKVKDKIQLIDTLLDKVDMMIVGGGMAYTFKKVMENMEIGGSLFDKTGAEIVPKLIKKAEEKGVKILLPTDFLCGNAFKDDCDKKVCTDKEGIPAGWEGMDNGEETRKANAELIKQAKTIIWNGPQGVFEFPNFRNGSLAALDAVIEATENGAISVVGGGDTASLVENEGKGHKISHMSTGGGASLELLEGKVLPGVAALDPK